MQWFAIPKVHNFQHGILCTHFSMLEIMPKVHNQKKIPLGSSRENKPVPLSVPIPKEKEHAN